MRRTFAWRVLYVQSKLLEFFGELVQDVAVVEDGGEGAVHHLGGHGRVGQEQRRAEVRVLPRV